MWCLQRSLHELCMHGICCSAPATVRRISSVSPKGSTFKPAHNLWQSSELSQRRAVQLTRTDAKCNVTQSRTLLCVEMCRRTPSALTSAQPMLLPRHHAGRAPAQEAGTPETSRISARSPTSAARKSRLCLLHALIATRTQAALADALEPGRPQLARRSVLLKSIRSLSRRGQDFARDPLGSSAGPRRGKRGLEALSETCRDLQQYARKIMPSPVQLSSAQRVSAASKSVSVLICDAVQEVHSKLEGKGTADLGDRTTAATVSGNGSVSCCWRGLKPAGLWPCIGHGLPPNRLTWLLPPTLKRCLQQA